jgi:hypothetical protein
MADDRLALLRELERADEAAAAELAEVDELYVEVEELRGRALELGAFLAGLPQERGASAAAVLEAERLLDEAQTAREEAAAALARAEAEEDDELLADARRRELAARDSVNVAERRATAARARAAELEARAEAAEAETRALEGRSAELGAALARRPRLADGAVGDPGPSTAGVAEWGTRARAALLVARSQLTAERDAVVRQANELGAVVLGEPLPPLGARDVVRRVETGLTGT